MARRKSTAAEKPPENQNTDEQWGANDAADQERAEHSREPEDDEEGDDAESEGDDEDDPEANMGGDGEGDPEEDLAAVSRVDHDAGGNPEPAFYDEESGEGLSLGAAMTPRQVIGQDPEDVAGHIRQADRRATLDNGQTDHERDHALDAVSGTPNPGITKRHGHSAPGVLGASDMSGGLPKADPFASAGTEVKRVMAHLDKISRKAIQEGKRGHGYASLKDLNAQKSVMDALVKGGHVTVENRAGGHFNPETGTVYRVASHREPEPAAE